MKSRRIAFWVAVLTLGVTHMRALLVPETLVFGWVPGELAYRLAWIVAASIVVFVMAGPMWEEAP